MDKKNMIKVLAGMLFLSPLMTQAWNFVTLKDEGSIEKKENEGKIAYYEKIETGGGQVPSQYRLLTIAEKGEVEEQQLTWNKRESPSMKASNFAVHVGTEVGYANFLVAGNGDDWPTLADGQAAPVSNVPQFFSVKKETTVTGGESTHWLRLSTDTPALAYVDISKGEETQKIYGKNCRVVRQIVLYRHDETNADKYFFAAPALHLSKQLGVNKSCEYKLFFWHETNEGESFGRLAEKSRVIGANYSKLPYKIATAIDAKTGQNLHLTLDGKTNSESKINNDSLFFQNIWAFKAMSLQLTEQYALKNVFAENQKILAGIPCFSGRPDQAWLGWTFGPDKRYGLPGLNIKESEKNNLLTTGVAVGDNFFITYHFFLNKETSEGVESALFDRNFGKIPEYFRGCDTANSDHSFLYLKLKYLLGAMYQGADVIYRKGTDGKDIAYHVIPVKKVGDLVEQKSAAGGCVEAKLLDLLFNVNDMQGEVADLEGKARIALEKKEMIKKEMIEKENVKKGANVMILKQGFETLRQMQKNRQDHKQITAQEQAMRQEIKQVKLSQPIEYVRNNKDMPAGAVSFRNATIEKLTPDSITFEPGKIYHPGQKFADKRTGRGRAIEGTVKGKKGWHFVRSVGEDGNYLDERGDVIVLP